jgi:DNA-binding MarR family transcriptional regulator
VNHAYREAFSLIERLHRRFLDVLRSELDRMGVEDINNVQSLILFNIGTDELTVGELTARGYYLGTNVTYNLKKLVESGYVEHERSPRDRRSVRVRLSDKGRALADQLDTVFTKHAEAVEKGTMSVDDLKALNQALRTLEQFWDRTASHPTGTAGASPSQAA